MFGVLAQIVPTRAIAASEDGPAGVSIGGYHADRTPFVFVEFISSGWGGLSHKDGIDGNDDAHHLGRTRTRRPR